MSDSFAQKTFKSVDLEFNDLTVGKTDAGFTINAGNLTVKNKLTVSGSKTFTVAGDKSLTLAGTSKDSVVDASKITVGAAAAGNLIVNGQNSKWTVGSLEVKKGKVEVSNSATLAMTKDAVLSFATNDAEMSANNATIDASEAILKLRKSLFNQP